MYLGNSKRIFKIISNKSGQCVQTFYADFVRMSGLETAFYSNNKDIYRFDIRKFHYSESRSKD